MNEAEENGFANYLTVAQAAAFLGVSADTLRNWDKSGKLRAARHPLNGYRLYRLRDLDHLLRSVQTRFDRKVSGVRPKRAPRTSELVGP